MTTTSPFSQNRFEYEGKHSYYLPEPLFKRLQPAKPKFLIGSRGSGKTTLLRALCWDEQTSNESLKQQLATQFLDRKYIGTYVKLPGTQLHLIDSWLHSIDSSVYSMLFSFYLELVYVQLIADALSRIVAQELFAVSVQKEHAAVTDCVDCSPFLFSPIAAHLKTVSLPMLAERASAIRKSLEHGAIRKEDPAEFAIAHQIGQIGSTTAPLLARLSRLCDEATESTSGTWHFKVCMDEGESLNERQQRVVRTLVRLAQWPLFPVLSFVRLPEDRTTTEFRKLTLQAADVEQITLDDMDKSEFKAFAEGVATTRCKEIIGHQSSAVNLYGTLGALDVNRILQDILSTSEGSVAKELLAKARQLSNTQALLIQNSSQGGLEEIDDNAEIAESVALPIWQAYVLDRLNLQYPHGAQRKEQRRYESIHLRKKMVGAYLSICRELQTSPRYASADMVLEISDNCIRDFLSQMDYIFIASGKSLVDFLVSSVPHDIQYSALSAASKAKKDSLPASGVQSPVQARRIIEGLAVVTAVLQASLPDSKHLEVPEQGKFAIELTEKQAVKHREVLDLLFDSAEAGFLRVLVDDEIEPKFRVHTSLAPAFGFSYRGAYYDTWLSIGELERLRQENTDDGVRNVAAAIVNRLVREEPRPLLKDMQ